MCVTAREEKLPPVRPDSPARDLKLLCDYRLQLLGERIRVANRLLLPNPAAPAQQGRQPPPQPRAAHDALTQARMDPRARAYVERRRSEGRTKRDAVRALKRHLSDAVYQQLRHDATGLEAVPRA